MLLFRLKKKRRIVAGERLSLFAISELVRPSEFQDLMRSISDCLRFFFHTVMIGFFLQLMRIIINGILTKIVAANYLHMFSTSSH